MVSPTKPRKVRAHGKDSWFLIPAVADVNAPTVAELNAAGGINVSCAVLAGGDSLTATANKVTLPAYLCETETFEGNDDVQFSMGDIEIGLDPQAPADSDDKEAFEFLRDGFTGFAARRQGVDTSVGAAVAGQFFDVVPVDITRAITGRSSTGNDAIYTAKSSVSVTGSPGINVVAVA